MDFKKTYEDMLSGEELLTLENQNKINEENKEIEKKINNIYKDIEDRDERDKIKKELEEKYKNNIKRLNASSRQFKLWNLRRKNIIENKQDDIIKLNKKLNDYEFILDKIKIENENEKFFMKNEINKISKELEKEKISRFDLEKEKEKLEIIILNLESKNDDKLNNIINSEKELKQNYEIEIRKVRDELMIFKELANEKIEIENEYKKMYINYTENLNKIEEVINKGQSV